MHQMYVDEIREKLVAFKSVVNDCLSIEIHRDVELAMKSKSNYLYHAEFEKCKEDVRKLEAIRGGLAPIELLASELDERSEKD